MPKGSTHKTVEEMTDHKGREVLGSAQRVLRLLHNVHQLLGWRGHEGREGIGGRARNVLYPIQRPQDGCHLGQLEVVDVHVDMELRDPLQRCLLLVQLHEEGAQDALADALAAVQV